MSVAVMKVVTEMSRKKAVRHGIITGKLEA
jgi:hypothetical protein